jgi:hypothetical protein
VTRVPCEACQGCGQRDLTIVERDTIQAVGPEWTSTLAIRLRLREIQGYDTKIPALNGRLTGLLVIRVVERRAIDGKSYEWRAT